MCLEIVALTTQPVPPGISVKALSRESGLHVTSQRLPNGGKRYHFATDPGCSCGFLASGATLDPEVWQLKAEHLSSLASAITSLSSRVVQLSFLAHYLGGERPQSHEVVSLSRLVQLIQGNGVRNNVEYEAELPNPALQRTRFARR